MNQQVKQNLKLVLMITIYILLGVIGIYSTTLIFLTPILMVPMAIFLMSNKRNYKRDLLIHLIISIMLYLLTRSIAEPLLYIISVAVPAHIFVTCYRNKLALPQVAMYTGVCTVGVFCFYAIGMKYFNIDYIQMYNTFLDTAKEQYTALINQAMKIQNQPISNDMEEQLLLMRKQFSMSVDMLKYLYPSLLLQIGIIIGVVSTIFMTLMGRIKKWRMLPLSQFVQFKFSRWMGILLVISSFIALFVGEDSMTTAALAMNLYSFTVYLLQIVGFIALIMLIRKSKLNSTTKTMSIVLSVLVFFMMPFIMMLVGLADTLFNFRKVDIIV